MNCRIPDPRSLIPSTFSVDRLRSAALSQLLVHRLLDMHDGSVEARSGGPGHGSELIVRLPLAAISPKIPPHAAMVPDAPSAPAGLRVLVVVDS